MIKNLQRHFAKALYVIPLIGVVLAGTNIWQPYSYWLDELYSVTTSVLPFTEMFRAMLRDVHPPLYQVLLWIWIRMTCPGIFRPSEIRDNGSLTARSSDEESTIYGRTDRSHIARS
jgi:hypothetical protein